MSEDKAQQSAHNGNDKPDKQENQPDVPPAAASSTDDTSKQFQKTGALDMTNYQPPMKPRIPTPNTTLLSSGSRVIFYIGEQRHTLDVEDKKQILIGRRVENDTDDSDITFDLTPYGAYHFGVSRRHAALTLQDGYLYLEDLGSTNGTRINGFQLTAHQKYRLRDGDEIEFARLRSSIRFRHKD